MSEYKIERFDVIMSGNKKLPNIYIKPDSELLEFAKKNNYTLACQIRNTGTLYDGNIISGVLNKSSLNRPNFFKYSELYVVTLYANWHGYPEYDSTGVIKFFGLGVDKREIDDKPESKKVANIRTESKKLENIRTESKKLRTESKKLENIRTKKKSEFSKKKEFLTAEIIITPILLYWIIALLSYYYLSPVL